MSLNSTDSPGWAGTTGFSGCGQNASGPSGHSPPEVACVLDVSTGKPGINEPSVS